MVALSDKVMCCDGTVGQTVMCYEGQSSVMVLLWGAMTCGDDAVK